MRRTLSECAGRLWLDTIQLQVEFAAPHELPVLAVQIARECSDNADRLKAEARARALRS